MTAMTPEEIVQAQYDAYNAQDLDALCGHFASDCKLATLNGDVYSEGLDAFRERHAALFAEFPQNRAILLSRMVIGDTVIDHEDVERAPGTERFQVAAIYTIKNGRVARVDYVVAS